MKQEQLRRNIRQQRRSLQPSEQQLLSSAICQHILHSSLYLRARRIGGYIANDGEAGLEDIFVNTCKMYKQWYLPILDQLHHNRLWFAPCDLDTSYNVNRYGIPEPISQSRLRRRPVNIDLILMPLVAFDKSGNRLGMGGGFYDKTFAFLRQRKYWRRPLLLGVAYSFQQVNTLTQQEWDIPLDAIVTEQGLQYF